MHRRTYLRHAAGIRTVGAAVAVAGCLGGEEEDFTLQVADADFGENDDGYLEAWVTVSNVGNEPQEGTLYVNGDLNDDPTVRVREVTLDAHETRRYTVTYDTKMDDVRSYSLDVDLEPPED